MEKVSDFETYHIVSWNIENFIYNEIKLNVLAQNSASKEIQIIMPKNSEMKEHKAPFAISVQVLRGWIEFSIDDKIMKLQELDMISLEANIPHSLKALKDSIVRLSLAKNDSVARVNAVLKN